MVLITQIMQHSRESPPSIRRSTPTPSQRSDVTTVLIDEGSDLENVNDCAISVCEMFVDHFPEIIRKPQFAPTNHYNSSAS